MKRFTSKIQDFFSKSNLTYIGKWGLVILAASATIITSVMIGELALGLVLTSMWSLFGTGFWSTFVGCIFGFAAYLVIAATLLTQGFKACTQLFMKLSLPQNIITRNLAFA